MDKMLKSFEDYRCGLFGFSDEVLYQNSLKDSAVNAVNRLSEYIASSLIQTCGWKSNEIAFLGVGQGGTIALEIGRRMEEEFAGLFVLSPDELPLACPEEKRRVTQRVVLINGRKDEAPSGCVQAIESELKLEGDIVQLHELDGKAMDVLKDRNGEGEIFMRFIASRLAAIRMRSLGAEEVN